MKKILFILLVLCFALMCSCGTETPKAEEKTMPIEYGEVLELAREEFDAKFKEFKNLEITSTKTGDRTDDNFNVVVEFEYTSENGNGTYGLEYERDDSGNLILVQQGKDVSVYSTLAK